MYKLEWHFDKRSIGQEAKYLEEIKKELRSTKKGSGGNVLRDKLGLSGKKYNDQWDDALDEIIIKMGSDFIKVAD